MPIYEYRCESCQHELERLQKISEAPLKDCPECGQASLRKKISAAGFRLSGSGWYETDFKASDRKKNLAGEKEAADSKKSDSDKSGDKKTAAKPADKKSDSPQKKADA